MTYGIPQISALIVLAARRGQITNPELKNTYHVTLSLAHRKKLISDGMISENKVGPRIVYTLTDSGWAHVEKYTSPTEPPPKPNRGGALYGAVLALAQTLYEPARSAGTLRVHLTERPDTDGRQSEQGQRERDEQPGASLDSDARVAVRHAYRSLARHSRGWVHLRDLRPELASWSRADIDAALLAMQEDGEVVLSPNDDGSALTDADREAALRFGISDLHMMSMR